LPDREPKILDALVHEVHMTHCPGTPCLLVLCLDGAKCTQGCFACQLRRLSQFRIRFDSTYTMVAELVLQILLDLVAADR
jgi:hypothetical protein